ncbi:MAG TPA: response regulator [Bryobacteraceae bacterium]|nr:response regulator [Bryobacteraceae bacterium]
MTNQSITNLFGYLSNEARNAMHAIVGLMEMRVDEPRDPGERASMDICRASADRLLRSIDDVQALFSDEPTAPSAPEEFDLHGVLADALEVLNLSASETLSKLVLETPQTAPIMVSDDRRTVELMLTRLMDSALKLTPRGDVRVSMIADQKDVILGLTPPDPSTIRQLGDWLNTDPAQIKLDGAMQVLTTVNAMVAGKWIRGRKGTVRIAPAVAGPATLAISLPLQREHNSKTSSPPLSDARHVLNVLVVEDCDESYALAKLLLKNERLWRASDGAEAIDMVKRRRFDVVFMDVHLPGTDGYRAIRAIRDWETETGNARTPMVVLSADEIGTQVRSAAESGCSGFLRKPVRKAEISALLDRLKAVQSPTA